MNIYLLKKAIVMPLVMSIMAAGVYTPVYGQTTNDDKIVNKFILYRIALNTCLREFENCTAAAWAGSDDPDVINAALGICKKTEQECVKRLGPRPKALGE